MLYFSKGSLIQSKARHLTLIMKGAFSFQNKKKQSFFSKDKKKNPPLTLFL